MNRDRPVRTLSVATLLAASCSCAPVPTPPDPAELDWLLDSGQASRAPDEGDYANRPFACPLSEQDAVQILLQTDVFALNAVGIEGAPSRQVQALNVVLDSLDASILLEDLLEHGHPAGRLYALCGLQVVQPRRFDAASERVGDASTVVTTFRGCIFSEERLGEVVKSIKQYQYGREFRRDRERTYKYFECAG